MMATTPAGKSRTKTEPTKMPINSPKSSEAESLFERIAAGTIEVVTPVEGVVSVVPAETTLVVPVGPSEVAVVKALPDDTVVTLCKVVAYAVVEAGEEPDIEEVLPVVPI